MIYLVPRKKNGKIVIQKVDCVIPTLLRNERIHPRVLAQLEQEQREMYVHFPQFCLCSYVEDRPVLHLATGDRVYFEDFEPVETDSTDRSLGYIGSLFVRIDGRPYEHIRTEAPVKKTTQGTFLIVPLQVRYMYLNEELHTTRVFVDREIWLGKCGFFGEHFYGGFNEDTYRFCSYEESDYHTVTEQLRDRILSRILLDMMFYEISHLNPEGWRDLTQHTSLHNLYNMVGKEEYLIQNTMLKRAYLVAKTRVSKEKK